MKRVRWKDQPDPHDYAAAASYLGLLADPETVRILVAALESAPATHYQAKDILRASELPALPLDNVHVAKDVARVKAGTPLAPILLIRGDLGRGLPLQIADGYHRVCASHSLDEDLDIPCRIVPLPASGLPTPRAAGSSPAGSGAGSGTGSPAE